MKLRCITILEDKSIPTLDEVDIRDNILYVIANKYSALNNKEVSLNNEELKFVNLENNIYSISLNEQFLVDFDKKTKWYQSSPIYQNIKIKDVQLWGDIVILKIVKDKIFELTSNEIDKCIEILKCGE